MRGEVCCWDGFELDGSPSDPQGTATVQQYLVDVLLCSGQ